MLIAAPPLLGHSQVSGLETPTEERRPCAPTAGQDDPAINHAGARLNNDSHLSGSRRGRLINTPLTCPELHLAYNNIDHSPPRTFFFLLDEITGTLFPLFSPWSSHGWLAGKGKKWSALGGTGRGRTPPGEQRRRLRALAVGVSAPVTWEQSPHMQAGAGTCEVGLEGSVPGTPSPPPSSEGFLRSHTGFARRFLWIQTTWKWSQQTGLVFWALESSTRPSTRYLCFSWYCSASGEHLINSA